MKLFSVNDKNPLLTDAKWLLSEVQSLTAAVDMNRLQGLGGRIEILVERLSSFQAIRDIRSAYEIYPFTAQLAKNQISHCEELNQDLFKTQPSRTQKLFGQLMSKEDVGAIMEATHMLVTARELLSGTDLGMEILAQAPSPSVRRTLGSTQHAYAQVS